MHEKRTRDKISGNFNTTHLRWADYAKQLTGDGHSLFEPGNLEGHTK